MSGIKKLAGQTLWYGASSIAARFINYLLTPYLTDALRSEDYGEMSLVYAAIPFLNVIFTYGLETAYFRFSKSKEEEARVYSTSLISILVSTVLFTSLLLLFNKELATLVGVKEHPEYLTWSAYIIALDALTALAFAKLRYEGRPVKFALVRISGIVLNVLLTVFFLTVCPRLARENPDSFIGTFYNPGMGVGYVIIANLIQAAFTLLFLSRELIAVRWTFDKKLWTQIIAYSAPLLLAGLGGMINETLDRLMLNWWNPAAGTAQARIEVGTYSACYKLSLLISLSIQAFRMGAEPFFFSTARGQDPQRIYARVMKFFVITLCFMFLAVALFIDIWKHFIQNKVFWEGLGVVPILLFANMFLGIYYNLSIWYKLSNKTMAGAWITLIGAGITLVINYIFIPHYSYLACAWATFFCYGSMMVISYKWGQKAYPVPYARKKLIAYMVICAALYGCYTLFTWMGLGEWPNRGFGLVLFALFGLLILNVERKELQKMPLIGKFVK